MSLINKFMAAGLACSVILASTSPVKAAATSKENGVIFRIENIKPVTNEDGITSQCEFYLTVYNRMDKSIKEATLDLSWTDNVSGKYKLVDNKIKVEEDLKKQKSVISKSVELKDVEPHKQKTFKNVVDTDKCFLLFDQVDYKVSTCIADGDNIKIKNNKRTSKGSCTNVFDYVNSQNPEYYSEFKDIPASELEQQIESQDKADEELTNNLYKESVENLEKISKSLNEVK